MLIVIYPAWDLDTTTIVIECLKRHVYATEVDVLHKECDVFKTGEVHFKVVLDLNANTVYVVKEALKALAL